MSHVSHIHEQFDATLFALYHASESVAKVDLLSQLVELNRLAPHNLSSSSYLIGLTQSPTPLNTSLYYRLRVFLVDSDSAVRVQALRTLRYLINDRTIARIMLLLNYDIFVSRYVNIFLKPIQL